MLSFACKVTGCAKNELFASDRKYVGVTLTLLSVVVTVVVWEPNIRATTATAAT